MLPPLSIYSARGEPDESPCHGMLRVTVLFALTLQIGEAMAKGDLPAPTAPVTAISAYTGTVLDHTNLQTTPVYAIVAGLKARDVLAKTWEREGNSAGSGT